MTALSIRGLGKRFGDVEAVSDLTFDVAPGRVTGFIGPNGAGKTTTMRMVLGLVRPSAGGALFDGIRYADLGAPRRVVGAVLAPDGVHPRHRGRDHLRVLAEVAGVPASRVDDVLELVDLAADGGRRVGGYSLGMLQRLSLAAALLGDPDVLVLDEPANGLDPAGVAWLRRFLRDLAGQGRTVLVSSHLLAELAQTIDDVVVVAHGRLRFSGPLDALVAAEGDLESAFLRLTGHAGTPALDGAA
jgi:ABC-2 type transport system ATP-binding protein